MKRTATIMLVILLAGCAKENRWDCFKSYGDEITEERILDPFHSVHVKDRVDVEFHRDSIYRVEVRFGENIIEHIESRVEAGELHISNVATCNWVRDLSKRPLVRIYAPDLSYFENRCSGDIHFADTLYTDKFRYEQWESNGNVTLLLNTDFTEIQMHVGYCDVTVYGRTSVAELYSLSNGRLNARGFISPVTLSNNSSIQNIKLYAGEYLYAEVNGSGSIFYVGDPEVIDTSISGSGTVESL
jgi:hypothetical protein